MTSRGHIGFLRRGKIVAHALPNPTQTVLDYLRLEEKSKGTKEGCNEGDCGACTVVLGELRQGKLVYAPVNACILLVAQLHGKELVTVDDLATNGVLHPVQQAMVDLHGSQCGFCTPGFVMSLFGLYHRDGVVTRQCVLDQIAGNLCRCTGYRPIVDAALKACDGKASDTWTKRQTESLAQLATLNDGADVFAGDDNGFVAMPQSAASLLSLVQQHPDATIVAGATDVGLWITKQMRSLPKIILTGGVGELHDVVDRGDHLRIGGAATYAETLSALAAIAPDVGQVMRRIGSVQVRNSGTIGGNIANGSPIGDMPPLLIALGAELVLRSIKGERRMALEDYFLAYGKQDRQPGELVWSIKVPKLRQGGVFRAYKISKRFDQDISAVLAAFCFDIANGRIRSARVAFGGMAGTPQRAATCEAALIGVDVADEGSWQPAVAALAKDFAPLSDMRASASYRLETAENLLRKTLYEIADQGQHATRVLNAGMA